MNKRLYRLSGLDVDTPHVDILGEFETYEAALDQLAVHRRSRLWRDFRIDEYVDGIWQSTPTPPPERRILKPTDEDGNASQ
jgi:hypothetical protein